MTELVRCNRCPDGRNLEPGEPCPFCGAIAGAERESVVRTQWRLDETARRRERNARPRPQRTSWQNRCKDCESLFVADHRDAKYCSQKCQKRARRAELVRQLAYDGTPGIGEAQIGVPTPIDTGPVDPVSRTAGPTS